MFRNQMLLETLKYLPTFSKVITSAYLSEYITNSLSKYAKRMAINTVVIIVKNFKYVHKK